MTKCLLLAAAVIVAALGCSSAPSSPPAPSPTAVAQSQSAAQRLTADTPSTTVGGATFIAPEGWSLSVRGPATILEAPEGDSWIALVDVTAKDADAAVAAAWAAYRADAKWPLISANPIADSDGWTDQRWYDYRTSPNEKRWVGVRPMRSGATWTVAMYDMATATGERRAAQIALVYGRLLPKGYTRESFAGRTAHALDAARLAELTAFIERGRESLGIPGVALSIVQDGKIVFAGGFGVRELGTQTPVDADTLFMIASNTKAMTTLMLATLVDDGKLEWDTPVTTLLPSFALGDSATTRRVLVKHLVCACTGMPRQDYEWLLEFEHATPASALATLATMQPTTNFGELYQYSNPLAAAGGYVGGHVAFPDLELGAAYDKAMQTRVFDPLGMSSTTFDFERALRGNHALPHSYDIDGKTARALMEINHSIVAVRPAGGAWSNARDVLQYVSMELAKGQAPGGRRVASEEAVLARRTAQISIGKDITYGMGLTVDTTYGVPVVNHGGSLIGYKSDMMWLPEHGVGAVILTNSDSGWTLAQSFRRKLLEVLFDGHAEADNTVATRAKATRDIIAAQRKLMLVPAPKADVAKLASRYRDTALGEMRVSTVGEDTVFDFGEWKSAIASRHNPDGTVSFMTIVPGFEGLEFIPGERAGKRTLVFRDSQHEYTFVED